jgi:integrase
MADKIQLTDVFLRKMKSPERGQTDIWDAKVPGFGVRVSATGTRTFVMVYRFRGDWRRDSLGQYPRLSLQEARAKAERARADLSEGKDPRAGRETARPAPKTESFGAAVDAFIAGYVKRQNRESTAGETERLLRSVFVPVWERRALGDIGKPDVLAVIDGIMDRGKPSAARHAFAAIRKFFNWCTERGLIDDSPCRTIKPPAKARSRERVLNDAELTLIWEAAAAQGIPFGTIVQLLMLTAQRRGEVVGMRWDELELDAGMWTIPGSRTKNHKPHVVPLTPTAVTILRKTPHHVGSPFVFPARGKPDQPYSGYSKGKRTLDAAIGLHDWTLHDLRRTAATGMARLGVPPHVVERILNHTAGTFGGVAGVYNRFQYLPEMREALKLWEAQLASIARAADGNERLPDK